MATSTTIESSSSSSPPPITRHCAYCLEESRSMKTCGGCKKRAYCSVVCQRKDWGESGQCHKMWCKAGVNFINVLCVPFLYDILAPNIELN